MRLCSNGPCLSGQNTIHGKNGLTGHKNNMSVILYIDKEDDPQNLHVVFCPNKEHSFEPSMFGACFRTRAAIPVSEFCILSFIFHLLVIYHGFVLFCLLFFQTAWWFTKFWMKHIHTSFHDLTLTHFNPSYSKVKTKSYFHCWATVYIYICTSWWCSFVVVHPFIQAIKSPELKCRLNMSLFVLVTSCALTVELAVVKGSGFLHHSWSNPPSRRVEESDWECRGRRSEAKTFRQNHHQNERWQGEKLNLRIV